MSVDDIATDQEMANLEFAIQRVRANASQVSKYQYTGYCLNPACFEEVERPKLFCDSQCANEFEKRKGLS